MRPHAWVGVAFAGAEFLALWSALAQARQHVITGALRVCGDQRTAPGGWADFAVEGRSAGSGTDAQRSFCTEQ
eukprot:CAMPEP_0198610434 /NCGR_PEP_ID=MMETSP1462-20131121/156893_1 /TAXON_ID=1333877 /ORGANISM="Brandtodinium nutriculum, Strain RCC3387" /LENGTH=72 /DNA_ID=CAMNT_0044342239 /DNA_START=688 /DNA_END=903 /DNA_ORIENTATION=+